MPVRVCMCVYEFMCVQGHKSAYLSVCVTACACVCVCVFMAQVGNNSAGDTNTKVLIIPPCSCSSTYKTRITIHLVDIEMHHIIKHWEIALLDIK